MHPLLSVSIFYLRFDEPPELTLYSPPAPVPLGVPDLEDNLDALLIERVYVDPDALVEESIDYLEWVLVPLLLAEPVVLAPVALARPVRVFLHGSRAHSQHWGVLRISPAVFLRLDRVKPREIVN